MKIEFGDKKLELPILPLYETQITAFKAGQDSNDRVFAIPKPYTRNQTIEHLSATVTDTAQALEVIDYNGDRQIDTKKLVAEVKSQQQPRFVSRVEQEGFGAFFSVSTVLVYPEENHVRILPLVFSGDRSDKAGFGCALDNVNPDIFGISKVQPKFFVNYDAERQNFGLDKTNFGLDDTYYGLLAKKVGVKPETVRVNIGTLDFLVPSYSIPEDDVIIDNFNTVFKGSDKPPIFYAKDLAKFSYEDYISDSIQQRIGLSTLGLFSKFHDLGKNHAAALTQPGATWLLKEVVDAYIRMDASRRDVGNIMHTLHHQLGTLGESVSGYLGYKEISTITDRQKDFIIKSIRQNIGYKVGDQKIFGQIVTNFTNDYIKGLPDYLELLRS